MFHGININKEEVVLDGSEAPSRIDAEALLASEKLAPAALLNKVELVAPCTDDIGSLMNKISFDDVNCTEIHIFCLSLFQIRIPYRPIDSKLCTLATNRDKLPSGKQILALILT